MRLLIFILGLLALSGCQKIRQNRIDNLQDGRVYVIGHGGEGFSSYKNHYHANSEISISRALNFHLADGVEVDVQLSKDFKNILYHDTKTSCTGAVFEQNLEYLIGCKYSDGMYFSFLLDQYLIQIHKAFAICMEMPDPKPVVLTVFGVNSLESVKQAITLNPDFIHTDNIPLTRNVLRSF